MGIFFFKKSMRNKGRIRQKPEHFKFGDDIFV